MIGTWRSISRRNFHVLKKSRDRTRFYAYQSICVSLTKYHVTLLYSSVPINHLAHGPAIRLLEGGSYYPARLWWCTTSKPTLDLNDRPPHENSASAYEPTEIKWRPNRIKFNSFALKIFSNSFFGWWKKMEIRRWKRKELWKKYKAVMCMKMK